MKIKIDNCRYMIKPIVLAFRSAKTQNNLKTDMVKKDSNSQADLSFQWEQVSMGQHTMYRSPGLISKIFEDVYNIMSAVHL